MASKIEVKKKTMTKKNRSKSKGTMQRRKVRVKSGNRGSSNVVVKR